MPERNQQTTEVVLVGSGGHASVVADIFRTAGIRVLGCISPAGSKESRDLPRIGADEDLPALRSRGISTVHIAIGDNRLRQKLTRHAADSGFRIASAISPHAVVSQTVSLGDGVAIMPGVVINAGSTVGDGVIVNTSASVDHDCRIGDFVHIAPGSHLAGCVSVGEGAFLGAGTIAIPGVEIGAWSVIGAGGVVVRPIGPHVTAVGVPARSIRSRGPQEA